MPATSWQTTEQIKRSASLFGSTSRIVGVTGTPDEMRKVIDGWMMHAAKLPSEDGDYHMSPTTSLLLIDANGRLRGLVPYGADQQHALEQIRRTILKTRLTAGRHRTGPILASSWG